MSEESKLTTQYEEWIDKVYELGFSEEGACGLAMIYQWSLTHQNLKNPKSKPEDIIPLGFNFVSEELFEETINSLSPDDLKMVFEIIRFAAKAFNSDVPVQRVSADGVETHVFDYEDGNGNRDWACNVALRHNFDILFVSMLGCAIQREELRKPHIAFVMAECISRIAYQVDPAGLGPIMFDLISHPSPLVMACVDHKIVADIRNYRAFELALTYINSSGEASIDEVVWYASKTYLYAQPPSEPVQINEGLEFYDPGAFLEKISKPVTQYLGQILASNPSLQKDVSEKYVWPEKKSLHEVVTKCMEDTFNVDKLRMVDDGWDLPTTLLLNAMVHTQLCYVLIRSGLGVRLH
ncbi:MAG: hypothetical protein ACI8P9_005552 [Parasphingorhabdus sp.]|jgi:hypothetical protein